MTHCQNAETTTHPFRMKKQTLARLLFFYLVLLLRLHALPPFTYTLKLSLHTEAKDMHPQTNPLCNHKCSHTHIHNTLVHAHTEKQPKPQNAHSCDLLSSDCNFFHCFLSINSLLANAERSVCVLVQGGFLKLSFSEACNLTERSFRPKTKKTKSKKQEKNSVQTGKGNLNQKKGLLCMNLLLNLKKVV